MDQHLIALGKTGSGKSSALRHHVEYLLDRKERVCIIDPKGDWWGLKFSADGKGAGYPVIAFGDFKEQKAVDVPINAHSGKQIAELISSGNRPCIIGMRGWMPSALSRFWIDFSSTIFNGNSNAGLNIIIDEVQNFAPKERLAGGDENLALHWTKRLMLEGRGIGIVMLMASQRPQSVHNTILTQCETLVAMKVIHESDRSAVETWVRGAGDKARGAEVLNTLASLPRGEAWVWSPEIGFGPKRVAFPMFKTFDSFAPPQQQNKIVRTDWSTVDLQEVKAKLAKTIEEVKENDPAELKRTIAELKRKVSGLERKQPEVKQSKPVEVPVLVATELHHIKGVVAAFERSEDLIRKVRPVIEQIEKGLSPFTQVTGKNKNHFTVPTISAPLPLIRSASHPVSVSGRAARDPRPVRETIKPSPKLRDPFKPVGVKQWQLGKCERELLRVIAQHDGIDARKLTLLAGYTWSGGVRNALASLRSLGAIVGENTGTMRATEVAHTNCGPFDPLPAGDELVQHWLNFPQFGSCERALLKAFVDQYWNGRGGMTADDLCKVTLYEWSGGVRNALSKLRTAGVIRGKNTEVMTLALELVRALNE